MVWGYVYSLCTWKTQTHTHACICVCVFLCPLCALGNIHTHTFMHMCVCVSILCTWKHTTHTHIHAYVSVCVCLCVHSVLLGTCTQTHSWICAWIHSSEMYPHYRRFECIMTTEILRSRLWLQRFWAVDYEICMLPMKCKVVWLNLNICA